MDAIFTNYLQLVKHPILKDFFFYLSDKIDLKKRDKYVTLSNLSKYDT